MPATAYYVLLMVLMVLVVLLICCSDEEEDGDDRADQPVESAAEQSVDDDQPAPPVLSAEQRLERARARFQALAAWAEAVLAGRAAVAVALTGQVAAPPVLLPLPRFPYAAQPQSDKPGETTVECTICLDPLLPGQLCSEVPPCRHVFHGECLGEWARSNGSCPLCRAKIVPGSDEVAIADDMV